MKILKLKKKSLKEQLEEKGLKVLGITFYNDEVIIYCEGSLNEPLIDYKLIIEKKELDNEEKKIFKKESNLLNKGCYFEIIRRTK